MQIDNAASPSGGALRILIVDDDAETRELHSMLLRRWQYIPVVAVGEGEALLADAVAKAQTYRCQIALVDMRLRDNYDKRDWSGLKLAPRLQPAVTIIISAFGDHKTAVAALKQYGAATFVGKEDGPEALQEAIIETARKLALGDNGPQVVWSHGLSSAKIRRTLFPDQPDVPDDQADELIRRMFPTAHVVGLTLIEDDDHASDQPAAPRRRSRVFRATVDQQTSVRVVKLGRTEKVELETRNYNQYVRFGLKGLFRPEKFAEALLWDMGAVAYLYLGGGQIFDSQHGLCTFTTHYRATDDVETILAPLRHFFSDENWGVWYTKEVTSLATSLFEAYDAVLLGKLHRELDAWRADPPEYRVDALGAMLPNPTRWLADHYQESRLVCGRQAVTHGDLHGDNLFVDKQHAWPIDFERTGLGPILRDFVELTQDILTRIAHLGEGDLPVVYDLAVGLCTPATPDQLAPFTARVRQHREADRALRVVSELQQLAYRHTRYDDQREYLWGLLINCLFVLTLLPVTDRRYTVTRLLAAVICGRLERWGSVWPLRGWPRWKQPQQPEQFPHGHALLIGVGSYARAYLSVPATARDAIALAEVLRDRQTAAYPPEQVTLLTNQEATRAAILRALDDLAARVARAPQATVLIFFAGHGRQQDQGYALLPHDYNAGDPVATTIDATTLRQKIDAIARHAQKLLILFNCCYAGGIGDGVLAEGAALGSPPKSFYEPLASGSGRVIITAAGPDERAGAQSASTLGHTVFGAHLLAALRGAAPGQGETVSVAELFTYLEKTIPEDASRLTDPVTNAPLVQRPVFYARSVNQFFPLTLRPAGG